MDGSVFPGNPPVPAFEASALLGILYAEDFDDPPPDPAGEPEVPDDPVEMPPPLTSADIEIACATAVQQARLTWEASQLDQRTRALAAMAAGITQAREAAQHEAAAIAEGAVTTMLAMLAGTLPSLCRTHGDAEVRMLLRHLLPTLQREKRVVVRVHPDLAPILRHDIDLLDDDLAAAVTIHPAPLPPGDVRVSWAEGALDRDTGRILTAMQDALAQLGLFDPTLLRSEALAQ